MSQHNSWWIYLIRTSRHALYCGITTNVERRFAEHQSGRGAKALRGKAPLKLVWSQPVASRQEALRFEARIKKLPKVKKEQIVAENLLLSQVFPFHS
ncbi:GIY-YIG nuclease family protein [Vibrio quintilis]|uniref:GIY-YIG nuclease superfamily protein n=1 Tax=Vibrio quintilis TaxID=1117707 RepID=A0A1M7YS61_9VIBR|nr:GIY-YIG nuclease family protein [Vibrio quintilis]SHO55449.1 GIY-YIG nuclease superfamily protein [Vibrio quintilis]